MWKRQIVTSLLLRRGQEAPQQHQMGPSTGLGRLRKMEKVVQKFNSFEEAERANRAYYRSLTPKQRTEILIQMIDDYYGTEHRLERVPESARIIKR